MTPDERLAAARARVRELESALGVLLPSEREARRALKAELASAHDELRAAREAARPVVARRRAELLAHAYRVLTQLDEAGVEIGDEGHEVLEGIEATVPRAVLLEVLEGEVAA